MSETEIPEPGAMPLRSRTIAYLHPHDEMTIIVEHVYEPEGVTTCHADGCGRPSHDPGMVGLVMSDEEDTVSALLDPGDALILAERLQRAASLVLQSVEDLPDIDREAARFAAEEAQ